MTRETMAALKTDTFAERMAERNQMLLDGRLDRASWEAAKTETVARDAAEDQLRQDLAAAQARVPQVVVRALLPAQVGAPGLASPRLPLLPAQGNAAGFAGQEAEPDQHAVVGVDARVVVGVVFFCMAGKFSDSAVIGVVVGGLAAAVTPQMASACGTGWCYLCSLSG
mmetsp:Transcript_30065/g.77418  ORF Transcript_30065/g.77418 Transcript_30065/m.77418 type:complete len:168 (+) Transcript_30065:672-1175(+)